MVCQILPPPEQLARPNYVQHSLRGAPQPADNATLSAITAARRDFLSQEVSGLCEQRARPSVLVIGFGCSSEVDSLMDLYDTAQIDLSFCADTGHLSETNVREADFIFSSRLLNEADDDLALIHVERILSLMGPGSRMLLASYCEEIEALDWFGERRLFLRGEEALAQLLARATTNCLAHSTWRDDSGLTAYFEISR